MRRGDSLQDLGIIPDGSVLIRDGRILTVGTTRRLENLKEARQALEIPVHGKVVLPGFIDAGMSLSLNRASEGRRPRRAAEFRDYSLSLMRACLQHGTVSAKVHASADSGDIGSDVAVLRKLVKISEQPVHMLKVWRVESRIAPQTEPADQPLAETLGILIKRGFIDSIAVTVSSDSEPDWEATKVLSACGLRVDLLWHGGPVSLLERAMKTLKPTVVCSSTPLTNVEASMLAAHGAIAVLPAGRQLLEGAGDAAATRTLINAGGALALSSGYYTSQAPNFNMQMAIALAVVRLGMTPEEAVSAATINAAHATGQADVTGSLEPGKRADIVILNIADLRELPQQFGVNHVAMVLRSGNVVLNRTRWRAPVEPSSNRMRSKSI